MASAPSGVAEPHGSGRVLRENRLFLSALALFVFLLGFAYLRRSEVRASVAPDRTLEAELEALRNDLAAFRSGDDTRLKDLRATAASLCERFLRCDAREIVEYYGELSVEERRAGVQWEQRYLELREQVQAATESGAEHWQSERPRCLRELEQLAQAAGALRDAVPAARTHALIARLIAEETPPHDDSAALESWAEELRAELEAAQTGFVRAGMLRPRIELEWIRARLLHETGQFSGAERGFEECLDQARRLGEREWQQRALDELYRLAEASGDLARMRCILDQLALLSPGGAEAQPWNLRARHALQLIWQDQPRAAEEFLRAHPPRAGTGREAEHHALLLGQSLLRQGQLEAARTQWSRVASGSPYSSEARLSEAQADLAAGETARALSTIAAHAPGVQAGPEREAAWRALRGEAFLKAGKSELARRDLEQALENIRICERTLQESRDPLRATNLFGEVLGMHAVALLAQAWVELGDPVQAACVIESAQSRTLRGQPELSRGDLLAWARSTERGLLTWIVAADHTLCIAVAPQGTARAARIPHGRRAIEEGVRRLREACWSNERARVERLSGELAQALLPEEIAPFALQGSGRILLLLHGPLEALPIECWEGSVWLPDALTPLVLPGLTGSAPPAAFDPSAPATWTLCGDPHDARGRPRLEQAGQELMELAELLPGARLMRGEQFERGALRAALAANQPVHIATHLSAVEAERDSRYAGLALELDGGESLSAAELARWTIRAPLVVLAACESAGGERLDGEGMQGPARALLEHGVPRLVVTLWPVEDHIARSFSLALHRNLKQGLSPAQACAQARRALRAQGAQIAQWAAFRALGSD